MSQLARFSPGIAVRLGVAFAAVAVLALAANMVVERGVRVVSRAFAPASVEPVLLPPALPSQVSIAQPPAAIQKPADSARVLRALAQFDRALQSQLAGADTRLREQLADARRYFVETVDEFSAAAQLDPEPRRRLRSTLDAYLAHAGKQVATTDARRDALHAYHSHLDLLREQVGNRLGKAWKVLGRVITRQYLVDLRDSLDRLRDQFVRTTEIDTGSRPELGDLVSAEENVATQLAVVKKHRDEVWVPQAQRDFDQLASSREEAARLSVELATADVQNARLRSAITRSLEKFANAATKEATTSPAEESALATADPHAEQAPAGADQRKYSLASDEPISARNTAVTSEDEVAGWSDSLLPWLSAGVLLLIFGISVATVRSVAGQVRRLQVASRRVAAGEVVHVRAGGIRELDVLAASFNHMSQELQGARQIALRYQQDLEVRVEERTRALLHQANHDPLTDLPNRRELFRLLEAAIVDAAREGSLASLFFLDLDNFKDLNDSMGHGFGDRVLIAMAARLREFTAAGGGFAARFGGDEFTVVMPGAQDLSAVRTIGWNLVRAFQRPLAVDGNELLLSVSVGVSVYPDHAGDPGNLLRAADAALFRAKVLGRSQLAVFTPELLDAVSARFATEQGLRRAVDRGEFELLFQPEVDSSSFDVDSVEALLRWRLPDGSLAAPAEFLTVAEESGLITEIGDWVLQEAIAAAGRWHHGDWPAVRVAINVSSRQMLDAGFVDRVTALLAQHRLPPHCIEIELTETVLQTGLATVRSLEGLHAMGVPVALDDFGTGYSSLTSLEKLPLSRVKLDRSLIEGLDSNLRSAAIVDAIVRMCRGLGLAVTAEGIERPQQLTALLPQGPVLLQGYLLSLPVVFDEIAGLRSRLPQLCEALLLEQGAMRKSAGKEVVVAGSITHTRRSAARTSP